MDRPGLTQVAGLAVHKGTHSCHPLPAMVHGTRAMVHAPLLPALWTRLASLRLDYGSGSLIAPKRSLGALLLLHLRARPPGSFCISFVRCLWTTSLLGLTTHYTVVLPRHHYFLRFISGLSFSLPARKLDYVSGQFSFSIFVLWFCMNLFMRSLRTFLLLVPNTTGHARHGLFSPRCLTSKGFRPMRLKMRIAPRPRR